MQRPQGHRSIGERRAEHCQNNTPLAVTHPEKQRVLTAQSHFVVHFHNNTIHKEDFCIAKKNCIASASRMRGHMGAPGRPAVLQLRKQCRLDGCAVNECALSPLAKHPHLPLQHLCNGRTPHKCACQTRYHQDFCQEICAKSRTECTATCHLTISRCGKSTLARRPCNHAARHADKAVIDRGWALRSTWVGWLTAHERGLLQAAALALASSD